MKKFHHHFLLLSTRLCLLIFNCSWINGLQPTIVPPLIDVPTYSLATKDVEGKTGMNILTYATPINIKPDRIWSLSLYKGTVTHDNFSRTGKGVLQLLAPSHATLVKLLGGSSSRDVDKKLECKKLGIEWVSIDSESPELLPNCSYYLKVSLVGNLIDCGSHELAICKIESMHIPDEADNADNNAYLNTAKLREMGIITKEGRVANK